ncbi:MAG: TRAP transporter small permease [Roseibium sp.]|nr:TRAP transporter small permease [Roseibium sp.]
MTVVGWLRRLDKWIETALFYLAGLLLVIIAGIVFYSVVMRYAFNEPPLWADEAPRALSLWMVFIGVAVATKRGRNIRVTHFIDMVPPRPRVYFETFMHILVLIMLGGLIWYNIPILRLQAGGTMLTTGWSYWWVYAPVSVGSILMLLYQSRLMINTIVTYRENRKGIQ